MSIGNSNIFPKQPYGTPEIPSKPRIDPKTGLPIPEAERPDLTVPEEPKPEAPKEEKETKTDSKQISEEAQQQVEERGGDLKTRTQQQQRSQQTRSSFEEDSGERAGSQLPDKWGHKININPEVARPRENPEGGEHPVHDATGQTQKKPEKEGLPQKEYTPKMATDKDYRSVANEKFFRQGPLKDTPMHKLFQRESLRQNLEHQVMRREVDKPLTRGELAQLVRLRHQSEEKEHFRNVLRGELAKAKLQRMARQVGAIRQQTDAKSQKNTTELMRAERSDLAKQQLAAKLSQSGSQSKFEQILQQVLAGNKTATQELAEGLKARFLIKTDAEWEAFFKNVLALDSTEVQSQAQLSKMIEALFRGLYKKPGTDQTLLIADLAMNENGEVSENKFSKLALNDPALQDLFGQLKPGDVIPPALLQKLGQEFEFIKLVNLLQLVVLSEAQKADILKAYRQQHSPEMQRRLEQALLGQREDDAKRERDNQAPFVYAGHVFEKPEQHKGNPKLFMSLFYGVAGITAALILYILARHLF